MAKPASRLFLNSQRDRWEMQATRIGQMMFAYSMDHGGKYPEGHSSTEVFQKLLDGLDDNGPNGHYASDPNIFYVPLVGKTRPVHGEKLKPENVGFDITADISPDDSEALPVVFMTGYRVAYRPGGTAAPLPGSGFQSPWPEWVVEFTNPESQPLHEIAVSYKSNNSGYEIRPEAFIPNFVSPDFDPKGRTYRQLTPNGPLP